MWEGQLPATRPRVPNFNELATTEVVNPLKFAAGDAVAAQFVYPPLL